MPEQLPIDDIADDERFRQLAAAGDLGLARWRFHDEEVIVAEGDSARELYLLEEGVVRVERGGGPDGGSRYLAMVAAEPGRVHVFGEMAFFLEGTRTATVRSIGGSVVLQVQERTIPHLFVRFPELARDFFAGLVARLRQTTAELRGLQDLFDLCAEQRLVTAASTLLYEAGEEAAPLFRVVSGLATVTGPEGRSHAVNPTGPEDGFVNLRSFLRGEPSRDRAEAAPGSILVVFPRAAAAAVVRSFPDAVLRHLGATDG
ncbi:MAG: cyclic nucleotide-binding domain-containing protein [Planctomycetes bacterium]|nr:cyclic nucleotide-binding domain-containing protein [Planctomycetota bacterium]